MIVNFFVLGTLIDDYLRDHPVTLHYKFVGGVIGAGLILFAARQMKSIVLRSPVRSE